MTETQFRERLQAVQDMLEVVAEQRDLANNTIVELGAKLKAAQRTIKQLEERVARPDVLPRDAAPDVTTPIN